MSVIFRTKGRLLLMRFLQVINTGYRFLIERPNSKRYIATNFRKCSVAHDIGCLSEKPFSSLYVSNRFKDSVYPVLVPDFDYEFVVENYESIKYSATVRGIHLDYFSRNANELKDNIQHFKTVGADIENLKAAIEAAYRSSPNDENKLLSLRNEMKILKEQYWHYEDTLIAFFLRRPNVFHPETGLQQKVLSKFGNCLTSTKSHIDISHKKKWLFFSFLGPHAYYMIDELAKAELAITDYFTNILESAGFQRVSAPNIVQTAILEATGKIPKRSQNLIQLKSKKDGLVQDYLVGSSSLEALVAYFTRMIMSSKIMPIKSYNVGRYYHGDGDHKMGLYKTVQSTQIKCLMICGQDMETILFNDMVNSLTTAYAKLQVPHQVVLVSGKELELTETIRVQVELWSPFLKRYLPCASVSQHTNFLSQRLMMQIGWKNDVSGFAHCVSSTAVSIPILIASLIENQAQNDPDLKFPNALQSYL